MVIKNNGEIMGDENNFHGNFGGDYVNGDKLISGCEPPPSNHPNARTCPQCWRLTWKATRECVWCGCDVWHQDELVVQEKRKKILKKRSNIAMVVAFCSTVFLFLSVNYFMNGFTIFFFFVCLFSLKLATDLDEVQKKL